MARSSLEMGPRRQRTDALGSLKSALTTQFGEQARSVVEAHIDEQLGRSKGQISRQHIDSIEKAIVSTLAQQRGSTRSQKSFQLSQSAPYLPTRTSTAGSSPSLGAVPPATPVRAPTTSFKLPLGTSNPGSLVRAASTGVLTAGPKTTKPRRPPPYGLSITGGSEFVDESARSGVTLRARYPVPLQPKLKPLDHWDLIVAFDSAKYRQEEKELHQTGTYARQMSFKKVLDDQMLEIQQSRDNEAMGKEEERDLMTAQIEENKKYKQEEEDVIHGKRDQQSKVNESMLGAIHKEREKATMRKQREQEEVTAWLESEKAQREEDAANQKIEYARKCAQAQKELEEVRADRAERHRVEQENEKRLMKLRDQIADENEAKKQKAFQDRKDHLDRVEKTMGAAVAERDAKDAADLEARIKQIQEEAAQKAMTDARRKQDTHNARVKDMVETRQRQMEDRGKEEELIKQEDVKMMAFYKKQYEEGLAADKAKEEKRRQARADQDVHLIEAARINAGIHPHHVMMTPRNRKTELGYNKAIYEQMMKEGFQSDRVVSVMTKQQGKPGFGHHPDGKLCPMPTIPRYTGELHPLELEAPDV